MNKRFLDITFFVLIIMALFVLFAVIFSSSFSNWIMCLLSEEKERVIKLIGLGMAGILAFFGAIAVNRRAEAQVENNELIEKGHIQERFRAAVEHLGRAEVTAHIASFYEFSYLARDNEDLRENIFDILCAHLRQTTINKEYQDEVGFIDEGDNSEVRPTEEVKSLLDVLFQSKDSRDRLIFAGFKPNLRRIFLVRASLHKANLQGARLSMANLQAAKLPGSDLRDAWLRGADLREAWLYKADLRGTKLRKADLRKANLREADLRNTDLRNADLREANLRDTDLQGIDLRKADLRRADLRGGRNLATAKLNGAKVKDAQRPEGFGWPEGVDDTTDADTITDADNYLR